MPFFSRVFFAIACFFRVISDGRFAAAVEQTKALPPASGVRSGKPSGTHSERDERHAIPPAEVATEADSAGPPSSTRARDTLDDLVRKTPADDADDDDDDDSIPPVSTESHNTGLRRRSPPKPNTVPPPPNSEGAADVVSPATEPSPGTLPPPSLDAEAAETSDAALAVDTDSVAHPSSESAKSGDTDEETPRSGALPSTAARDTRAEPPAPKSSETATPREAEEAGYAPRERGALLLLALLQREGRFVDFLQQDVTDFDDEQIGAAARVVHEGCRKALKSHLKVAPIRVEVYVY